METPRGENRSFDLLVVGEVNPDVVVTDRDPRPAFGQAERIVDGVRLTVGSSSAITACGAARLGVSVSMIGIVGNDPMGDFIVSALDERGVATRGIRVDPDLPTGASVILSDGRDRAILTALGSIGAVTAADAIPHLGGARHLHIGSWFLQRGLWPDGPALLRAARDSGLTTSIDPNWDPDGTWDRGIRDLLPLVDVFLPNAAEVCRIANEDDAVLAATELARLGPLVVVKCGGDGAFAVGPGGDVTRTAAYPAAARDTTGAGDSFDAGFLASWLATSSIADSLRAGAVCGALSTRAAGGVEAQPSRDEARQALAAWPA